MVDMAKHQSELDNQGFTIIKGVLQSDEIDTYRQALSKAIDIQNKKWNDNKYYIDHNMVHNPMIHDKLFLDFLAKPAINDPLEQLFDPACILYAFTTTSMPPEGANFSNRIHIDSPRHIQDYPTNIGVLVAVDAFTEENGATYFLPGSHKSSKQPTEDEFFENAIRVMLAPGEAVLFNARTWHMGGQNNTKQFRHALSINICRPYMRQRFDYPRLLGNELLGSADERLLRLLGYRVRTPVTLEEYYVSPEKRLYMSGQG